MSTNKHKVIANIGPGSGQILRDMPTIIKNITSRHIHRRFAHNEYVVDAFNIPEHGINSAYNTFFTFQQYVKEALTNPDWGFYVTQKHMGYKSMAFLISAQIAEKTFKSWLDMIKTGQIKVSDKYQFIDIGSGDSSFGLCFLTYVKQKTEQSPDWQAFYDVLDYTVIDVGDLLLDQQREMLKNFSDKTSFHIGDIKNLPFNSNSINGTIFSFLVLAALGAEKINVPEQTMALSIPYLNGSQMRKVKKADPHLHTTLKAKGYHYIKTMGLKDYGTTYISAQDYLTLRKTLFSKSGIYHDIRFLEGYVPIKASPEVTEIELLTGYRGNLNKLHGDRYRYYNTDILKIVTEQNRVLNHGQVWTIDMGSFDILEPIVMERHLRMHSIAKYNLQIDRGRWYDKKYTETDAKPYYNPYLRTGTAGIFTSTDFNLLSILYKKAQFEINTSGGLVDLFDQSQPIPQQVNRSFLLQHGGETGKDLDHLIHCLDRKCANDFMAAVRPQYHVLSTKK